ncbi:hypothetical protein J3Q64DRAFT_1779793 [Phycomyces blakesleeanus]|uniref:MARVEL domain-containing protein n=2 Tax=Phycomyces blakesleeanus TaxID=4837 RepID=A0A167JU24_PHYB8|nr:hypothetical protein PHYBLDRAFT_80577 [Phycomyces blakesleeanus NRRL 1555(-)]OAD66709.1 hypothetical protein PHYBLDRAFT_80577 [Phycomyces blakesleeanus NRRL 1555(-)]|eukprot:XP_018284749.1 hypothetical protein PHYBLDRAFT_80577 [Phycomyces blakesleeanus NRRL 1555(-)]
MTGHNPFTDNPWEGNTTTTTTTTTRQVNAYEDQPQTTNNAWAPPLPTSPRPPPPIPARMPSPSAYHTTTTTTEVVGQPTNAYTSTGWQESNKTESAYDSSWDGAVTSSNKSAAHTPAPAPAVVHDAYQYSGTPYGNQDFSTTSNAYGNTDQAPSPQLTSTTPVPAKAESKAGVLPPKFGTDRNPSKRRVLLRFLQFISAIGSVGFAAGASPFAGVDVPLSSAACLYFLYAVAIVSIIWSGFHLIYFLLRRVSSRQKMNRPLMTGLDLLLAIMWGIGVIVEVVKYRCSPGGYNHWCDFYNVSIFWGFFSLALFIVATGWDFVGACVMRKRH